MYSLENIKNCTNLNIVSTRNFNSKKDFVGVCCPNEECDIWYTSVEELLTGSPECPNCSFSIGSFNLTVQPDTNYNVVLSLDYSGFKFCSLKSFNLGASEILEFTEKDLIAFWFTDSNIQNFKIKILSIKTEVSSLEPIIGWPQHLKEHIGLAWWSPNIQQLKSKNIAFIRELKAKENNNLCTICHKELNAPTLDHTHIKKVRGTGFIRDVCCSQCNTFIARSENNASRHGISRSELPQVLRNMADHLEKETNLIHPSEAQKRKKVQKREWNKVIKYYFKLYPNRKIPPHKPTYVNQAWLDLQEKINIYIDKN